MKQALVFGKFLPPHVGHKHLIDFAKSYPGVGVIRVVVCSMPGEPISGNYRYAALSEAYYDYASLNDNMRYEPSKVYVYHFDKEVPQEPSEHPNFWNIWKDILQSYLDPNMETIVFASEPYGMKVAEILNAQFIPVDIKRDLFPVSGTLVRSDIEKNWNNIIPEMRKHLTKTVTLFGAESTGKTTVSKQLAYDLGGQWVTEYARVYLETHGNDITDDKLRDIARGQYAQDKSVLDAAYKPWIIRDTDLLTTLGWNRVLGNDPIRIRNLELHTIKPLWQPSDLYILLDDSIPFEQDGTRYGDGVRQTDTAFWEEILIDAGVEYIKVDRTGKTKNEAAAHIYTLVKRWEADYN